MYEATELAWAAGFVDGEGWIGCSRWSNSNGRGKGTFVVRCQDQKELL